MLQREGNQVISFSQLPPQPENIVLMPDVLRVLNDKSLPRQDRILQAMRFGRLAASELKQTVYFSADEHADAYFEVLVDQLPVTGDYTDLVFLGHFTKELVGGYDV